MDLDSQANQWNLTEVLPATTTLKGEVVASLKQMRKTNTSSLFITAFKTSAHVLGKTSICLPWVGEVPHLPCVPLFHVSRPLA